MNKELLEAIITVLVPIEIGLAVVLLIGMVIISINMHRIAKMLSKLPPVAEVYLNNALRHLEEGENGVSAAKSEIMWALTKSNLTVYKAIKGEDNL